MRAKSIRTQVRAVSKRGPMPTVALVSAALAAVIFATEPAQAQSIICCSQNIAVGGGWIGSSRVANCQEYFNSASTAILRRMCQQRDALSCLNTDRCSELPPGDTAAPGPATGGADPPAGPDRDGLEQGFYGPPPAPSPPPAAQAPMPRRLVYLMPWPTDGRRVTSFTVWLDHAACPLPLGPDNRLADSSAAKHVVRGKITHRDGRVRIEADAQQRPGGMKLGPFIGEAEGEDAAAVAKATRAVTEKLKLVCTR
jgi:hypothetical protein